MLPYDATAYQLPNRPPKLRNQTIHIAVCCALHLCGNPTIPPFASMLHAVGSCTPPLYSWEEKISDGSFKDITDLGLVEDQQGRVWQSPLFVSLMWASNKYRFHRWVDASIEFRLVKSCNLAIFDFGRNATLCVELTFAEGLSKIWYSKNVGNSHNFPTVAAKPYLKGDRWIRFQFDAQHQMMRILERSPSSEGNGFVVRSSGFPTEFRPSIARSFYGDDEWQDDKKGEKKKDEEKDDKIDMRLCGPFAFGITHKDTQNAYTFDWFNCA